MNQQKNKKITIALDGFSSCGKSTLAKALAKELNYVFVDSGAMYRAVTLYFLNHKLDLSNSVMIEKALENIKIEFKIHPPKEKADTYLNGKNVETEIRQMEVSNLVSEVAAIKKVRQKMVALQREMGNQKGIVMDGRDIGTNVFPNAELKIFMTAQPAIRAKRRFLELQEKGEKISLKEIEQNLALRDKIDTTRKENPLTKAPDALLLDNSELSPAEQLAWALAKVKEKIQ